MNLFFARLRNRWLRMRLREKPLDSLAKTNLSALDHLDSDRSASDYPYVVFDLETTGLNLKFDRVVSVGAFRIVEGRIRLSDVYFELINPGRKISHSSIRIHGVVPDMVLSARSASEVFDDFLSYLGTDILVAHHAPFDLHFINKTMVSRYGFPIQNLALDTAVLCRNLLFPTHPYPYGFRVNHSKSSLDSIAKHFDIQIHDRHTSLGDALATAMIFQRILAKIESTGSGKLKPLLKASSYFSAR